MITPRAVCLSIVLGLIIAACSGGGTSSPGTTGAPSAGSPEGGAGAVIIVDFAFQPANVTVAAGSTVTWSNTGQATHSVKWSDGEPESPRLAGGATYARTFDAAGAYTYVCGIHGTMSGTITVTE
jgi:plastocyanin